MQLTRQDIQIVEKIIQTKKGLFLARFAVAQIGGEFKWKLIDMVEVPKSKTLSNTILAIAAPFVKQITNFKTPFSQVIKSPYLNFDFFVSQPTRAPNFA
jgi:hypothetical protein